MNLQSLYFICDFGYYFITVSSETLFWNWWENCFVNIFKFRNSHKTREWANLGTLIIWMLSLRFWCSFMTTTSLIINLLLKKMKHWKFTVRKMNFWESTRFLWNFIRYNKRLSRKISLEWLKISLQIPLYWWNSIKTKYNLLYKDDW